MPKIRCRAVIMDYADSGERIFEFETEEDFFDMLADDVVVAFMRHIDGLAILNEPVRYELNAAKKFPERHLVSAMGALLLQDGSRLPFIVMIASA